MIVRINLKDPDGVADSINDAAAVEDRGHDDEAKAILVRLRRETLREALSRWIEFRQYLRIEFDTDLMTARVLEVREE